MSYIRKTTDEYNIEGYYYGSWERLHTVETWKDARNSLKDYEKNEKGISFRIKKVRVKKIETTV